MAPKHLKIPVWATFFTLLGVLILCSLGFWQLQRLTWKTGIIKHLDIAYASGSSERLDPSTPFSYGEVDGIFLPEKAILIGPRKKDNIVGNHVIVPLIVEDKTLFVDMGWTATKDLTSLPIHHLNNKNVSFEGLSYTPGWNRFTPENDIQNDLWFKPDIQQIAAVKNLPPPFPTILIAERANYKFDAAFPNNERHYPNNNHLQYALFWFSMAVALACVYCLRFLKK